MGGCCTLTAGRAGRGASRAGPTGLVYIDGHLDLYDGVTSPTGEAADMPMSVAPWPWRPWVEAVGGRWSIPRYAAIVGFLATSRRRSATTAIRTPKDIAWSQPRI